MHHPPKEPHEITFRNWLAVYRGLHLTLVCLAIVTIVLLAVAVLAWSALALGAEQGMDLLVPVVAGAVILIAVCLVGVVIGEVDCCEAPAISGAKNWAGFSILCYFISPVAAALVMWLLYPPAQQNEVIRKGVMGDAIKLSILTWSGVAILAQSAFLISLGRIAQHFRNPSLRRLTSISLICGILLWASFAFFAFNPFSAASFVKSSSPTPANQPVQERAFWAELFFLAIQASLTFVASLLQVTVVKKSRDAVGSGLITPPAQPKILYGDVFDELHSS